jgi:hypothetical protein
MGLDGVPWRGPKEKGVGFMSSLIRACCIVSDLVANVTAGACNVYVFFWFQCLLNFVFICLGNRNV